MLLHVCHFFLATYVQYHFTHIDPITVPRNPLLCLQVSLPYSLSPPMFPHMNPLFGQPILSQMFLSGYPNTLIQSLDTTIRLLPYRLVPHDHVPLMFPHVLNVLPYLKWSLPMFTFLLHHLVALNPNCSTWNSYFPNSVFQWYSCLYSEILYFSLLKKPFSDIRIT